MFHVFSVVVTRHPRTVPREMLAVSNDDDNTNENRTGIGCVNPAQTSSFNKTLQQFMFHNKSNKATKIRYSPRLKNNDNDNVVKSKASPSVSLSPSPSNRNLIPKSQSHPLSKSSPSKVSKVRRPSSKYAAPSRYAHLDPLVDILQPDLILVFVGVNPGISTAIAGHAYAHPSNRFWHLLHVSGLTPERKLSPTEDRDLPRLYGYGNTNIVERPTKDQGELSKEEMVAGAAVLEEKFRTAKPEAVVIVGKGIWEAIWRWRYGKPISKAEFHYGWQEEKENMGRCGDDELHHQGLPWIGSKVFVATSTSGQAASMKPAEREAIWRPLGEWAQQRRAERG